MNSALIQSMNSNWTIFIWKKKPRVIEIWDEDYFILPRRDVAALLHKSSESEPKWILDREMIR